MDLDTLKELKLFDVELGRWKHICQAWIRENSDLPEFVVAKMCIEELIEYVLKSSRDVTDG